jgi:signal transduction histidine kinase
VFTVCVGLQVTHTLMSIYSEAVAVNQRWAERAFAYTRLGELAAIANAPGNDVFISRDPEAESTRMRAAMWVFDQQFAELRHELAANLPPADAQPLIARLDAVGTAIGSMAQQARLIFSSFRAGQAGLAAERMAAMDAKYADANSALADLRQSVARVQQRNFQKQLAAAAMQQDYEYLIGALILVMVGGATLYGHRMARHIQAEAAEKERHLEEIGEAQAVLEDTNQRLQALFRRTLDAQEAQRQHIARELHEEVAQMLGALKMRLSSLRLSPRMRKEVEPQVKDAGTIAERALHRLQDLARDLTPLGMDFIGLAGVLVVHLKEWTQGSGLAVHFSEDLPQARPPFEIETAAYRVAQEAVANVVRHAHARNLRVALIQVHGELQLHVSDDGVGLDVESIRRDSASGDRLGITLMEQRTALLGGRLEITSAPARGTSVKAIFPTPA